MRAIIGALSLLTLLSLPGTPALAQAQAQDFSSPTEAGTTTMPAGQYIVTAMGSNKSYTMTVTSKGLMIVGPCTAPATAAAATTTAAVTPAATAVVAPAAGTITPVAPTTPIIPVAPGAVPAATNASGLNGLMQNVNSSDMKHLLEKGAQRGAAELMKMKTKGTLDNLLK